MEQVVNQNHKVCADPVRGLRGGGADSLLDCRSFSWPNHQRHTGRSGSPAPCLMDGLRLQPFGSGDPTAGVGELNAGDDDWRYHLVPVPA